MQQPNLFHPHEGDALAGLQLLEEIGRGAHSIVYRARREGQLYAVKVHREGVPSRQGDLALRFRREAAILARVRHPALPAVMVLGEMGGHPCLVMEFVEGRTLASLLQAGPLAEEALVRLARRLAGALATVHHQGLVHRDIKPQNILLDAAGDARLIDFGLAEQIRSSLEGEGMAGTFLYSAPEQSGMLKRPVDGRADLYALGVVLFECATGNPPFRAREVGELLRQHAVLLPPDVRTVNPAVSPALAAIIARLLAKDPDDRYQTSEGLEAELAALPELNASHQRGEPLPLGLHDEQPPGRQEVRLVGREPELAGLRALWQQVQKGAGAALLLSGEAGSGKSRLMQAFLEEARVGEGLLLVGQGTREHLLPFAALRTALEGYLRHVQRLPDAQRLPLIAQLRQGAGEFAPLLHSFSPLLAPLLPGEAGPKADGDTPDLFYEVLADFLLALARAQGRALLFLDDGQWLDEGTRQLLRGLAGRLAEAPLLLILAGADVASFASDLGLQRPSMMQLERLGDEAVGRLVSAYLGGYRLEDGFIGQLATRTQGNPLALIEYLRAMLEAGLLRPSWGSWLVDGAGLEHLHLPTDVLALLLRRVEEVGEESRQILAVGAVMGSRFTVSLLAVLCQQAEETLLGALTEGIAAHLIEPGSGGSYLFVHEQVHEALLAHLDEPTQRALHQRLAETLERTGGDDDHLFVLARHYTLGETERTPERVYQSTLAAGRQALAQHAEEAAYSFLTTANDFAPQIGIPPVAEGTLAKLLGDACAGTGRWEEAIRHYERYHALAPSPLERAGACIQMAEVYLATFNIPRAWVQVERAFDELGTPYPRSKLVQLGLTLWDWGRGLLTRHVPWWYGSARGEAQARARMLVHLYSIGGRVAYFGMNQFHLVQMMTRALYAAHLLGPSRELVDSYCNYTLLMALVRRRAASEGYALRALEIAEALGDRGGIGRSLLYRALSTDLCGEARAAEQLYRRALDGYGRWLDAGDYLRGCLALSWNYQLRGYTQNALNWAQHAIRRAELASGQRGVSYEPALVAASLTLLGRPAEGASYLKQVQHFAEQEPNDVIRWASYLSNQLIFCMEQEELGAAIEANIARHRQLRLNPRRTTMHWRSYYVAQGYARLAQALRAEGSTREATLGPLREAVDMLKQAATIPLLRAHLLVIEGATRGLEGHPAEGLSLLSDAEALAHEIDCPWVLYESAHQRAHLFAAQGDMTAATRAARVAHTLAMELGWVDRAQRLRARFQLSDLSVGRTEGGASHASPLSTDSHSLKVERYLDALQQVSLASASVLDPAQQMRVALDEISRILGAERAYLFLYDETQQALVLETGRDAQGQDLMELEGYSRTIVSRVWESQQPVVVSGTEEGAALGAESVVIHGLRSILAVPLRMQEQPLGVVYLDNHLARGLFSRADVEILLAIANHIAIAREMARMIQTQASLERLQEMDRLKSRFFASVSHELRTPLNAIIGFSNLLLKGIQGPVTERQIEDLATIHRSGKRLLALINDILDHSKIEAGQMKLVLAKMQVEVVIQEAMSVSQLLLQGKAVTLSSDLPATLPSVVADQQRVYQVLLNLLTNAAKFTTQGTILVQAIPGEEGVTISVRDTGEGIPVDRQEEIFKEFSQVEAAHGHRGTGLGLPISRRLVELHGGRLWVESQAGVGSAFYFTLPLDGPLHKSE